MRLHQIPSLGDLADVVSFFNHGLEQLFIEEDDFLDLDSEVILIGEGVSEHDAGADTDWRDDDVVDDEVSDVRCSSDVDEEVLLARNIQDDLLGLPRVQLKDEVSSFLVASLHQPSFHLVFCDLALPK